MKLKRTDFLSQMNRKQVDVQKLKQNRALTDEQKQHLTKADINNDGFVSGAREMNHLFAGMEHFDGDSDRQNLRLNQVTSQIKKAVDSAVSGAAGSTQPVNRQPASGSVRRVMTDHLINSRGLNPVKDLKPNNGVVGLSDPSALKIHHGNFVVTEPGTVIKNLDIRGRLFIQAKGVKIENCKINGMGTEDGAITFSKGQDYTGIEIKNTEITNARLGIAMGGPGGSYFRGGADANKLEGLYIHGVGDGLHLGSDFTLDKSRIETKRWIGNHSDGVQIVNRGNVKIKNSYIDAGVHDRNVAVGDPNNINSAVFLGQDFAGDISNVHIDNSYLDGGDHIYRHWHPKHSRGLHNNPTGSSVTNSWFGPHSRHEAAVAFVGKDGSPTWSNNRYVNTNREVELKIGGRQQ